MLSTIELNMYSYLVVDDKGNQVGEIHCDPDRRLVHDTQPWKLWINNHQVHQADTFMKCFRVVQQQYKKGLIAA